MVKVEYRPAEAEVILFVNGDLATAPDPMRDSCTGNSKRNDDENCWHNNSKS